MCKLDINDVSNTGESILNTVISLWKGSHEPGISFSKIILQEGPEGDGALAKVNIVTKELRLDLRALIHAAYTLKIEFVLFIYYTLSHELAHIIYQKTNKASNEEYFAHDYAFEDCCIHLGNIYTEKDLQMISNLREKIIMD
jgi:hypothetical protein